MRLLAIFLFLLSISAGAQDSLTTSTPKIRWGITVSGNYSFSGMGSIADVELLLNKKHVIYTGPKILISRSYLPLRGPWGWNLGYKYEYSKSPSKKISFFFNADYQVTVSEAYSTLVSSNKHNQVHEIFVGYGMQYKFNPHLYLGNSMGIGLHYDIFNNADLNWKQEYYGYNNLFRVFLIYRF